MSRLIFYFLTILFWFGPMAAQAYQAYDPRVDSPRYPYCNAEYNKCDDPCLTQMGGNASYACHNACARNFDKCIAGDSQRESIDEVNAQYRLKQQCENQLSNCQLYTCDQYHGTENTRACFDACRAKADQCMAALGIAPQRSSNQTNGYSVNPSQVYQKQLLNSQQERECGAIRAECAQNTCSGQECGSCIEGFTICMSTEAANSPQILNEMSQEEKSIYLQLSSKEKARFWIQKRAAQREEINQLLNNLLKANGKDAQEIINQLRQRQ